MKHYMIMALLCVALSGCGIKPSSVDAPNESGKREFPRTYPDPQTDPEPATYHPYDHTDQE